jgi:hypothetical protein
VSREEFHATLWLITIGLMLVAGFRGSTLSVVSACVASAAATLLVKKGTSHDS